MKSSTSKYCKKIICLTVLLSIAVGGHAQNGGAIQKAVFDGISLPDFSASTEEIYNHLLLHGSGRTTIIPIQPTKLQLHPYLNIHSFNNTKQNVITSTPFVLSVPIINSTTRARLQAIAQQQADLDSSFVDNGKEPRDWERLKNASLILLYGMFLWTDAILSNDSDNNGISDIFER